MAKAKYFQGKTKVDGKIYSWRSTFPVGTTYNCEKCGICCAMVGLTPKDVGNLKRNGHGKQVIYGGKNESWKVPLLKMNSDGFCSFLNKETLCKIYSKRPMMCRAYPYSLVPGLENNLVIDISLRCPYVDLRSEPNVKKKELEEVIAMYSEHIPKTIAYSVKYRNTLAEHLRVAYAPAFFPLERSTSFMGKAIDLLKQKDTVDMISLVSSWADSVARSSQEVIIQDGNSLGSGQQDKEILSRIKKPRESGRYSPSKDRWFNMFDDLNNTFFSLIDDKIWWGKVKIGDDVKINKEPHSWGSFRDLSYSAGAVEMLTEYMKMQIRRSAFRICVAKIGEYIVDYKNSPAIEYDINCMLFSSALITHIDPLSRVLAKVHEHGTIEASDVRLAIGNIDSSFVVALTNGMLLNSMIKNLDGLETTSAGL